MAAAAGPCTTQSAAQASTATYAGISFTGEKTTCNALAHDPLAPEARQVSNDYTAKPVVRGRIELPTFRFSGGSGRSLPGAGCGQAGHLAAMTVAGRCWASPGYCGRWLPGWLPNRAAPRLPMASTRYHFATAA